MKLRSGNDVTYKPVRSGGFNVRGRAVNADAKNVLVTTSADKLELGRKHGVRTEQARAIRLEDTRDIGLRLDKEYGEERYLLVAYGADYLYFAPAPLRIQGARPNAAAPRRDSAFAQAPDADHLSLTTVLSEPPAKGDEKNRDTVMGGSARNYAGSVYGADWANSLNWEWLHIIGHALGGNNEVGNLVAGTYDANTAMIPLEKNTHDLASGKSEAAKGICATVVVSYEVDLYPESWVAIGIEMSYSWSAPKLGFNPGESTYIRAQTDLRFDKLQYDLWQVK